MNGPQPLEYAIEEFAKTIGLEEFKLDEDGYGCLVFDEKHAVSLFHDVDSNSLVLSASLGPLPGNPLDRDSFVVRLLKANHLWQQTGGATLGLADSDEVTLSIRHQVQDIEFQDFENLLKEFVGLTDFWTYELETISDQGEPEEPYTPQGNPTIRA